jgi:hypothetical protein
MSEEQTLRITLEALLELPLAADALATVWREAINWTSEPTVRRRLAIELAVLELDRCRELGESRGWSAVLPRLDGWETTWHNLCAMVTKEELAQCEQQWKTAMERLLTALQQHLNTSMKAPPATDEENQSLVEWAELVWWCWERRSLSNGDEVLRERLCRLGAIAWMALAGFRQGTPAGLQAAGRAQAMLVELTRYTPVELVWVRNGLQDGLAAHLESGPPADGDWSEWLDWAELIVERSPNDQERRIREEQLWSAKASLEIAKVLGI